MLNDRINHQGTWHILKDYAIDNDKIKFNITNAITDEQFVIKVRYMI